MKKESLKSFIHAPPLSSGLRCRVSCHLECIHSSLLPSRGSDTWSGPFAGPVLSTEQSLLRSTTKRWDREYRCICMCTWGIQLDSDTQFYHWKCISLRARKHRDGPDRSSGRFSLPLHDGQPWLSPVDMSWCGPPEHRTCDHTWCPCTSPDEKKEEENKEKVKGGREGGEKGGREGGEKGGEVRREIDIHLKR